MALDSPRVLVTGASGLIGRALVSSLKTRGVEITYLVRGTSPGPDQIHWDPARPLAPENVSGFDAVVHLAGESVASRWTNDKRAKIRDSRVTGTRTLAQALAKATKQPRVLVTSSAIGYYGDRADEVLNEKSAPGTGFLADVCREWEAANQPATDAGIRTVQIRTGIVLSAEGGALKKMLLPFRMGVGGRLGSGGQWMSWIHIHDMVGAIHHVMKTDLLQGPENFVAPKPVTNVEFTETLASVLKRPAIFPVPALAIKTLFGQMAKKSCWQANESNWLAWSPAVTHFNVRNCGRRWKTCLRIGGMVIAPSGRKAVGLALPVLNRMLPADSLRLSPSNPFSVPKFPASF
jgi:uncharacterized protein (TIGR01777 family)